MPSCHRRRHQDRDQDQHRRQRLHEAADDQQHELTTSRNTSGLSIVSTSHRRQRLRDATDRQAPAERRRRHHQREHDPGGLDRLDDDSRQHAPDRSRDRRTRPRNSAVERGDGGGFGRREDARCIMPPNRITGVISAQMRLAGTSARGRAKPANGCARQVPAAGDLKRTITIRTAAISSPGIDAGEEQAADRDVGGDAIDHHRQRRRDDRPDGRRRGSDRRRRLGVVALVASSP